MADSDSFINEVTEEVRRDRLYAVFRRWAWLAVLIVVVLVGGAAWFEYQRAQDQAAAEAFGDSLISALDGADPEARIAALAAIEAPGAEGAMILALLAAGEAATGADAVEVAAQLRAAAETPDLPRRYRDLAMLKAEMMAPSDAAEARLILGTLAEPGAPYAALAEEQLALLDIREGDLEAGLDRLRSLERSAAATTGLQQRAAQLIVALEAGSDLIDTSPVVETPAGDSSDDAAEDRTETAPQADAQAEADAEPGADTDAGDAPAEETPATGQ